MAFIKTKTTRDIEIYFIPSMVGAVLERYEVDKDTDQAVLAGSEVIMKTGALASFSTNMKPKEFIEFLEVESAKVYEAELTKFQKMKSGVESTL